MVDNREHFKSRNYMDCGCVCQVYSEIIVFRIKSNRPIFTGTDNISFSSFTSRRQLMVAIHIDIEYCCFESYNINCEKYLPAGNTIRFLTLDFHFAQSIHRPNFLSIKRMIYIFSTTRFHPWWLDGKNETWKQLQTIIDRRLARNGFNKRNHSESYQNHEDLLCFWSPHEVFNNQ